MTRATRAEGVVAVMAATATMGQNATKRKMRTKGLKMRMRKTTMRRGRERRERRTVRRTEAVGEVESDLEAERPR